MRNSRNMKTAFPLCSIIVFLFAGCGGDETETPAPSNEPEVQEESSSITEEMPPPVEKAEVYVPEPEPTKPKPDPNGVYLPRWRKTVSPSTKTKKAFPYGTMVRFGESPIEPGAVN